MLLLVRINDGLCVPIVAAGANRLMRIAISSTLGGRGDRTMERKYFSLQEANDLLPLVAEELESLQQIKRRFDRSANQLHRMKSAHGAARAMGEEDPFFKLECDIEFLQIEARTVIQSMHKKGAELKDIELGLIDFPARMNGEDILLCWKQGEDRIRFYHRLDDGFAGRKPIPE